MRAVCRLIVLLALWLGIAYTQEVREVAVPSASMGRDVRNLVILPKGYDEERSFPVVYLLHGWEMKYHEWLRVQRDLPLLASQYGLILVCPDGANGWYWDSPLHPEMRFETYVAKELPRYICEHFKATDAKSARAICGLSMGGHGALWLAIRHQDTFGACGSMSGAVDIRPFPNRWNMADSLGAYEENPERWAQHTVMTQLHLIQPGLAMLIDCGTEDFFHRVNEELHRELLARHIPHDYISRPGAHNARYWRNAVLYQLLYFAEFFKTQQRSASIGLMKRSPDTPAAGVKCVLRNKYLRYAQNSIG